MVPELIKANEEEKNPSPGVCLPVIVNFCQYHKVKMKLIKSSLNFIFFRIEGNLIEI